MKKTIAWICLLICLLTAAGCAEALDLSGYDDAALTQLKKQVDSELIKRYKGLVQQAAQYAPTCEKEILFQGIPWGTDIVTAREQLLEKGFPISQIFEGSVSYWKKGGSVSNPSVSKSGFWASAFSDTLGNTPVNIGGYPINHCSINCYYDYAEDVIDKAQEKSHLIYASVTFDTMNPQFVYQDLVQKMSSLYGEAEAFDRAHIGNYTRAQGSIRGGIYCDYACWYGLNNTVAQLVYTYQIEDGSAERTDETLVLSYSVTDSKEKLDGIEQTNEKIKQLEEKQKQMAELEQLMQNQNNDVSGL